MADGYTGWKLFDKVTIVAKKILAYDYKTGETTDTGNVQGYLVDPSNKKQLEAARNWGTAYKSIYEEVDGKRQFVDKEIIKPDEYTYDNDGFTLELYNSAEGSSQGGKLSFWNCWITAPDGHRFLIGIAADLLLDVLKSSTIVNGVVQDKLMFARCHGGVGMLSKSMDSYKDAIKDEEIKKNVSKGKTSKYRTGHIYETITEKNVYFGKFYRWYEPIWESRSGYASNYTNLRGFKKLDKPVEQIFFPGYDEKKTKMSEYIAYMCDCRDKAPTRKESDKVVEVDTTMEEVCKKLEYKYFWEDYYKWVNYNKQGYNSCKPVNYKSIGISTNDKEYTMSEELKKALTECGYEVID